MEVIRYDKQLVQPHYEQFEQMPLQLENLVAKLLDDMPIDGAIVHAGGVC